MKRLFLMMVTCTSVFGMAAQLKVAEGGTVVIGPPSLQTTTAVETINSLDAIISEPVEVIDPVDYSAALNLFPKDSSVRSYLSFGNGISIGAGTSDIPYRLMGFGPYGFSFSTAEGVVMEGNKKGKFFFYNDVETTGLFIASDEVLKKDIANLSEDISSGLENLNPVSYTLASDDDNVVRYGLIAQEVQQVFPNLVSENENGTLSVDYIGLIPLMLNKINSLQQRLDELEAEETPINCSKQSTAGVNGIENDIVAKLYQNDPNPFSVSTVISCDLSSDISNAYICIYDLQGKQLMQIEVRERGNASAEISGDRLAAGMYIYALIADGKEVASKRMILTD